jgi:hypothetical protein
MIKKIYLLAVSCVLVVSCGRTPTGSSDGASVSAPTVIPDNYSGTRGRRSALIPPFGGCEPSGPCDGGSSVTMSPGGPGSEPTPTPGGGSSVTM